MTYAATRADWPQGRLSPVLLLVAASLRPRLTKPVHSGAHSRLHCPERRLHPPRHFGIRQFGKERRLDRVALVHREDVQSAAKRLTLLLERDEIVGIDRGGGRQPISGFRLYALLALLEP